MPDRSRRLTALVGALTFLDLALWVAVVPLLPRWEEEAGLGKGQTGIVLAAYSLAIIVASLPVGYLVGRLGAKRLTAASTAVFAVTVALLPLAHGFAELVVVRFGQGLFSAVSWTAGLAWLLGSLPAARRTPALAVINSLASVATLAGPAIGGPLVAAVGLGPTMAGFAALLGLLLVWCLLERDAGLPDEREAGPAAALASAVRDRPLRASIVAMAFIAGSVGILQLLAPLRLADEGLSGAAIGWVFAGAACCGIVGNLATGRYARRVDRLGLTMAAMLGVGGTAVLLVLPLGVAGYALAILLTSVVLAPAWVLLYPMATDAGEAAGIGHGVALGALNTAWATGALASPVVLGALAGATDDRVAFLCVAVGSLLAVRVLRGTRAPATA